MRPSSAGPTTPGASSTAAPVAASPTVGRTAKARKDLQAELALRAQGKGVINLVVAGHVDAGKSTMMGRLLVEVGDVADKTVKKVAAGRE